VTVKGLKILCTNYNEQMWNDNEEAENGSSVRKMRI
jgi:hypothetical protein